MIYIYIYIHQKVEKLAVVEAVFFTQIWSGWLSFSKTRRVSILTWFCYTWLKYYQFQHDFGKIIRNFDRIMRCPAYRYTFIVINSIHMFILSTCRELDQINNMPNFPVTVALLYTSFDRASSASLVPMFRGGCHILTIGSLLFSRLSLLLTHSLK